MNIIEFFKMGIKLFNWLIFTLVIMISNSLCFIFIFPFCKPENTYKAKGVWFAWHPVLVGDIETLNLKNLRWLVFVKRIPDDWMGIYLYEDN